MTTSAHTDDLFLTPRYDESVAEDLKRSASSDMWRDWDLAGLLDKVPCQFAETIGAKYGIFCSTGTAGLHAALMALDLQPGDEVVVPCMTFIRAVTPLIHLGLRPVLADVDPHTGNISPDAVVRCLSPATRAIVVVHMWGIAADMEPLLDVARRNNLFVIEDFSHAHLSMYNGSYVGAIGDVGFASLQRKKVLSVGEGGIVVTSNEETYARLKEITSPGSFQKDKSRVDFSGFGLNMRISPFSAVVARNILGRADAIVASRETHVRELTSILCDATDKVIPPHIPRYATRVSPYGFKPLLSGVSLDQVRARGTNGLWRFGPFSYDSISQSPFWKKSRAHYPFCLNVRPRTLPSYPGHDRYVESRVSLAIPTPNVEYWTEETRNLWRTALLGVLGA